MAKETKFFKNEKTGLVWTVHNPDTIKRLKKDQDFKEVKTYPKMTTKKESENKAGDS
ncbi:hypothetical protein [Salimicrobium halophilum]|uniref:Uncharacterized protein n=1 Tax=Salimicrobium halophilum TaxID=86666 RepID=A0A1G8WDX7_9BACI|nr:hypothetical protein [Salimicrobium halophilum]SDJ76327.1 hypothetical protein SAMN04490247_3135 [Salimicrobium halophilum]